MPLRPHPSNHRPQLGLGSALAAICLVASACGIESGVASMGATPNATNNPGTAIVDDVPVDSGDVPLDDDPAPDTVPDDTAPVPTAPTTPPDPTVPPVSTLPPIVEPELAIEVAIADVVDVGDAKPFRAHDTFVAVAVSDIERWWAAEYPSIYGESFEPLEGGIYAGYPERTTDLPGCGEPVTSYSDLELYGAFYCSFGDFMVYDDGDTGDSLLTPLADEYGPAVLGVVLAHEYGHAIQARNGALDRALATVITEQQADCFAGAWTGQAYRGESGMLRLGDRDVRTGLIAMLSVSDPVGTNQFTAGGHGSAFDRVGAFQLGFVSGATSCADLLDSPLTLMPNQFQPFSLDELLGGDAAYDCDDLIGTPGITQEIIDTCTDAPIFLSDDLNDFWATALDPSTVALTPLPVDDLVAISCTTPTPITVEVVLCVEEAIVAYDEPAVLDLYELGDFTLGYLYGIAWAEYAQAISASTVDGERRALLNDCYAGAWVRDITPDDAGRTGRQTSDVSSSPGDLDEAIRMAILVGDEGANIDRVGSPFEKIESFRIGVLGGIEACDARFPG